MRPKLILNFEYVIIAFFVIVNANIYAQDQPNDPGRGTQPGASYSISDIENINLTNGNLMLNIPLVGLPKGRGQVGNSISLVYNSKLYDTEIETLLDHSGDFTPQNWLVPSQDGGWKYASNGYSLRVNSRWERTPVVQCNGTPLPNNLQRYVWKVSMYMPDGSKKEFRPTGRTDGLNDGFFDITPNGYQSSGCLGGGIAITGPMTYYSTDGSYIKLVVDHVVGGDDWGRSNPWTLYMPDGSRVTGGSGILQRTYDRNNNYIEGGTDNFGRSISIQANAAPNEDHVTMRGVNNEELKWKIKWKTISVNKSYETTGVSGGIGRGTTSTQTMSITYRVVDRITLPVQLGELYYEFGYNSEPGAVNGWGEVSRVKLPSGAEADYEFATPIYPPGTDGILQRFPDKKTLTYQTEYDGIVTPVSEVWLYDIDSGGSTITAPNGSITTQGHGDTSYDNLYSGLVLGIFNSDGSSTQRIWAFNRPAGSNTTDQINPYIKTEITTIPDNLGNPSLTTIRDFNYDKNGNITKITEYDWFSYASTHDGSGGFTGIPSGAVPARITENTYYNQTEDAANTTTNNPLSYWNTNAPM